MRSRTSVMLPLRAAEESAVMPVLLRTRTSAPRDTNTNTAGEGELRVEKGGGPNIYIYIICPNL